MAAHCPDGGDTRRSRCCDQRSPTANARGSTAGCVVPSSRRDFCSSAPVTPVMPSPAMPLKVSSQPRVRAAARLTGSPRRATNALQGDASADRCEVRDGVEVLATFRRRSISSWCNPAGQPIDERLAQVGDAVGQARRNTCRNRLVEWLARQQVGGKRRTDIEEDAAKVAVRAARSRWLRYPSNPQRRATAGPLSTRDALK